MRTNIVIDDALMEAAMRAGGFKTKKEAVEEGLRLLARREAYQKLLALRGKLQWMGDESIDWTRLPAEPQAVQEPAPAPYVSKRHSRP
ncbi:Arc/MetJ family transcription regulator [Pseudacidovorax sp. 1753]|uniref:type II toxin-antitoxin system VapB family antitoxin n=1 Tax=Pseudacidovorax sp. 1753 TaxID=3156419 RepID=UPI003396F282